MSAHTPALPQRKSRILAPLLWPFAILSKLLGLLLLSLLIPVGVEWIGITWLWPDQPDHARKVLAQEVQYLGSQRNSLLGEAPAVLALSLVEWVYGLLTDNPVARFFANLIRQPPSFAFAEVLSHGLQRCAHYIDAALFITLVVCVRLLIVVLSVSLFVLVALVCIVDGLVERELRKLGGGHERDVVYHKAIILAPRLAICSPIIYLSWPGVAHPGWFFVPSALIFGIAVFYVFSTYQKYL